jgi:hypothetical protein
MNGHPSRDELELLARDVADDSRAAEAHVANCDACAAIVEEYRGEDDALRVGLAPVQAQPGAFFLKRVLASRQVRPREGWGRQAAAAAVILVALMALLFAPTRATHRLLAGAITLADGRRLGAPSAFEASPVSTLETLNERATIQLADGTLMELRSATRVEVREVNRDEIERLGGEDMKAIASGVLVTVLAGSLSLSQAHGNADLTSGRSAVLSASHVPVLVGLAQEGKAALAKRLETLAVEIAKLEGEVKKLETEHAGLKAELQGVVQGGGPGGSPGQAPGSSVKEK